MCNGGNRDRTYVRVSQGPVKMISDHKGPATPLQLSTMQGLQPTTSAEIQESLYLNFMEFLDHCFSGHQGAFRTSPEMLAVEIAVRIYLQEGATQTWVNLLECVHQTEQAAALLKEREEKDSGQIDQGQDQGQGGRSVIDDMTDATRMLINTVPLLRSLMDETRKEQEAVRAKENIRLKRETQMRQWEQDMRKWERQMREASVKEMAGILDMIVTRLKEWEAVEAKVKIWWEGEKEMSEANIKKMAFILDQIEPGRLMEREAMSVKENTRLKQEKEMSKAIL